MTTTNSTQDSPNRPAKEPISDDDLVGRLKEGQSVGFVEVLERYEHPIFRFFYFSHGDRELAEDQCSDTFVALVEALRRTRGQDVQLRPYLYGIARNLLRKSRRVPQKVSLDDAEWDQLEAPGSLPSVTVGIRQQYQRALATLQTFEEPMRQILLLRYVEEMPLEVISVALDLPIGTVKSHLHRSRKKVVELMMAEPKGKQVEVGHEK